MSEQKWKGSGLTKKQVVIYRGTSGTFHLGPPLRSNSKTREIDEFCTSIKKSCGEVLRKAGLPDHEGQFVEVDGNWIDITARHSKDFLNRHNMATILGVAKSRSDYEDDGDIGFAARLLHFINQFELDRIRNPDRAYYQALVIGEIFTEWRMKALYDAAYKHGQKMRPSGASLIDHNERRASENTSRNKLIRIAFADEKAKNGKLSDTALRKKLASRFCLSSKQIGRILEK